MKKKVKSMLLGVMSGAMLIVVILSMSSGSVYAQIPIPIGDCAALQAMQSNLNGNYYLTNDIDCYAATREGGPLWNSGAGFVPVGDSSSPFTGTFDGQGHKITGLFINRPSTDNVSLFGYVGSGAKISNVGLVNVNITGGGSVGGLVGWNFGAITNSYSTGSVSGNGNGAIGGLVGDNVQGAITNSFATGSVSGGAYRFTHVGGLVGHSNYGTITNSYSTGSVSGSGYSVGGLVGANEYVTITNSYSTGSVTGMLQVGGLVGQNIYGIITNSYSTGNVTGGWNVGGLVGLIPSGGSVTNSYWDIGTSGQSTSAGGTGKTTSEMKQQSTFVGWDFATIWAIHEGVSYPYLLWQIPLTEPINKVKALMASGDLNKGNGNALTVKLEGALDECNKGNYSVAVNQLGAFINQAEAFRGKKLTVAKADELISDAQKIIQIIHLIQGAAKPVLLSETVIEIPQDFSLSQNFPNPFNPITTIQYTIPAGKGGFVRITIYDSRGSLVQTLVDGAQNPGIHTATWNATDDSGRRISSGIYIYRLEVGSFTQTRKMLFLR